MRFIVELVEGKSGKTLESGTARTGYLRTTTASFRFASLELPVWGRSIRCSVRA
jgi:hypothetical protein